MAPVSTVLDWKPVEETLAAFRTEYAGLDGLVEELFGEVEKLRDRLAQKAGELERQRHEADERREALQQEREEHARLARQFEQQERQLSAALTLLEEVKHGLEETPAPLDLGADVVQLQGEVERLRSERDSLRSELDAARAEAPRWEQLLAEIERFGSNLDERLQNAAPPAESHDGGERLALLEQERAALIAELEQVRARAAELHEELLHQQRENSEQNARLVDEIQQLRRLVERQADLLQAAPRENVTQPAGQEPASPRRNESAEAPADPVVNSVMAQFAQLQKDVARRRKRK